ncbi:hypothetical protein PMZ80_010813 [Knufia obscura]|uniref:Cytochrome P450 n=1 Tax=Knufia obscura TaxID=1635080 RepID=A0ABR0R9G7_9EURO|nr:hypothetical protein PMZ80_010813 [Knufia obscura]
MDSVSHYGVLIFWISVRVALASIGLVFLKFIYNISPFHPLAKYPGPLLWRASRLPASYHHARGDLYQHIAAIHAQYGSSVRIAPDELSFTAPEAWPQIYNSRPQLKKSIYHFTPGDRRKLPESMIMAPDAEHTRLRRLTGPAFLNAGIAEVEPVLQHYVDLLCTQLANASKEGSQNMAEWFLWALNDVIGQLALDQEFQCLEKRRMHPWPSFLLGALKSTAALNQFRRFGISRAMLKPLIPKKVIEEQENFLSTAQTAVSERLKREQDDSAKLEAGNLDEGQKKQRDIVGLMMREMKGGERLTEAEVTANSILIVGGGAETTSTCLSATLYHLCKTPRVMEKLRDEIRRTFAMSEDITIKACNNMAYLKASIDESLRMFPVASFITPRMTPKGGHTIAGEVVPEGTYVSMGQWYMGRSERFFDEPKEFKPERWLDSSTEQVSGMSSDEILRPFSLGPRNCVGKLLALAEARLVTAKLLWHFDIELDGDHATWVEDARFYILWQLQPLKVNLTPIRKS